MINCNKEFKDCQEGKTPMKGKCDTFIFCQLCINGRVEEIKECCVKPDKVFVNLPRVDGAPTKREFCKNCGNTSGMIKMSPSNEWQNLPVLTSEQKETLHEARYQKRKAFYEFLRQKRAEYFEKNKEEFTRNYHAHLKTSEWKVRRDKVLERDNFVCMGCMKNKATEVHHLTYDHVFNEPLFDLVSICEECHKNVHPEKL